MAPQALADLEIGDILISNRDYLYSSPIIKDELLTVVGLPENGGSLYVTRNNGKDDIRWALTPGDFEDTYDFYWDVPQEISSETPTDTPARIDSHYDFFYELSQHEAQFLQLKVDPYFVSKQWRVGERDHSGALFHILKTIARFGDKNGREREIKAIYLQIKRLAELEGVELPE